MLRAPFFLTLLLISSCSLFKKAIKLSDSNVETLLNSVRMTGEGRGRLSLNQGQNVFSYEAVLKDEGDWLLAVSVPLHGEEVMVLRQIKKSQFSDQNADSFEVRLQNEITSRVEGGDLTGEDYMRELRAMVRLILAPQLNLKRECSGKEGSFTCLLDQDSFQVKVEKDKIFIRKVIKKNYFLELSAENLTGSFFTRTNFHLHSRSTVETLATVFSLELFWK